MDDLGVDYGESSVSPLNASLFSSWEEDCSNSVEQITELEKQVNYEKDNCSQKLWLTFQNAACSVAQLYKDRENGASLWVPFQNAAKNVTCLFQEGIETQKKIGDICFQYGVQKRNKEILAWAKKKKRLILREDLIAFLTNNYAHHHYTYPYARNSAWTGQRTRHPPIESPSASISGSRTPPNVNRLNLTDSNDINEDGDLQTFREALSALGIRSQATSNTINSTGAKRNNGHRSSPSSSPLGSVTELNEFISNEFTRHFESRKRSISSSDVIMDSPTHKRSKLI